MSLRWAAPFLLCLALVACAKDSAAPPPVPPPPPPPPAPTVSAVVDAVGPTRLAIVNNVLYWVDETDAPFRKLALTPGATPAALFARLPAPLAAISDGNFVYWVGGFALFRTTLDGATTTVLDVGAGPPGDVVPLAQDASHVYWASSVPQLTCSPACKFEIRRVPKAGGPGTPVVTADGVTAVYALALAGDYLFWEEDKAGTLDSAGTVGTRIMKLELGTTNIGTVVNGRLNGLIPPPGPGFIPASWFARGGIVADTDFVYFADADFFQRYRVMAVPVAGGAIDILLADTTHTASDFVRSLTHDDNTLYWVDENDVRSLLKSGGSVTDLAAARPHKPGSLTRVGTNLYWLENHCCLTHGKSSIYTIPTAGGTPAVVHDSVVTPLGISSDATHISWIEGGPYGAIEGYAGVRVSALDGSNVVSVVESAHAGPFAADANAIYFANQWTIKRVSNAGGTPQRLAIGQFYITDVATDGERVYWVEDPSAVVRSVPVNGGPITTLGVAAGPAGRIRLDATYVYWLSHEDEVHRVPKTGGTSVKLVGPVSGGITDFDVDATSIYISGWDSGTMMKAPLAGGTTTPLVAIGLDQTRRIAAHAGKVYWIDQLDVRSVTSDGQTVVPIHSGILSGPFEENGLAFDNQSVYWTEWAMDVIRKATPK